jgi:hypothetical protein
MQLIATGIRTLHDARYFAAMGASWIGFDLSVMSIDEINAISEWVVGPQIFAELKTADPDQLFDLTQKTGIKGISIPAQDHIPSSFDGSLILRSDITDIGQDIPQNTIALISFRNTEMKEDALNRLGQFCSKYPCWLEVNITHQDLIRDLKSIPAHGIAIRTIEDDVSDVIYDQYDALIESLEEIFPIQT